MRVFISYSRADWTYVQEIARRVRRLGVTTWVDIENLLPGERWEAAIGLAIRDASLFVSCISQLSLESRHTERELGKAVGGGLDILPVMLEHIDPSHLPEALRERQLLEVWRHPVRIGAQEVARAVAQRLQIPDSDHPIGKDSGETSSILVLYFGTAPGDSVRTKVHIRLRTLGDFELIERFIHGADDYALLHHLLPSAVEICVVVGEGTPRDACSFVLGYLSGTGHELAVCVLYVGSEATFAKTLSAPLRIRHVAIEDF